MRNVFLPGLLALLFSLMTSSAMAGNVLVCEEIKDKPDYKGLYGLCNAYWNETDPDARADILAAFRVKAGLGGPTMPGLVVASCPCWDETHLATASSNGTPTVCQITGTNKGVERALYGQGENIAAYTFYVEDAEGTFCFRVAPGGSNVVAVNFSEDEEATCRAGIGELVDLDFGGSCDKYLP